MAYNTFPRKQYGKIFVEKAEDIDRAHKIIKKMDEFEYSYLPKDFISVFEPIKNTSSDGKQYFRVRLTYTHKFDSLDLNEFQFRCWESGIKVFCLMGSEEISWVYCWDSDAASGREGLGEEK